MLNILILILTFFSSSWAYGLPQGGQVVAGQASIPAANQDSMAIQQTSDRAIINWKSFNIESHQHVQFDQPSSKSIVLNRVTGTDGKITPAQLDGMLTANGHVWLVDPAGIFIGENAQINVGGIVQSTIDMSQKSQDNFMAGVDRFVFDEPALHPGPIINRGHINVGEYGLAALIGPNVANHGVIEAQLGSNVILSAGNKFTLRKTMDFYGDGMINFAVDIDEPAKQVVVDSEGNSLEHGIHNTGKIVANGGHVLISAEMAKGIVDQVINLEGIVEANVAHEKGGTISLSGGQEGQVRVAAQLNASNKEGKGGSVHITGRDVLIDDPTEINANGETGGGEILIGGDREGKGTLPHADSVFVMDNVRLSANAITNGDGGKVVVWGDRSAEFFGWIFVRGGKESGNGGYAETSAPYGWLILGDIFNLATGADFTAPHGIWGQWVWDPQGVFIGSDDLGGGTYTFNGDPNYPNTWIYTPGLDPSTAANANINMRLSTDVPPDVNPPPGADVRVTTGSQVSGDITVEILNINQNGNQLTLDLGSTGSSRLLTINLSNSNGASVLVTGPGQGILRVPAADTGFIEALFVNAKSLISNVPVRTLPPNTTVPYTYSGDENTRQQVYSPGLYAARQLLQEISTAVDNVSAGEMANTSFSGGGGC